MVGLRRSVMTSVVTLVMAPVVTASSVLHLVLGMRNPRVATAAGTETVVAVVMVPAVSGVLLV